jgi:hypothetical protein
MVLLVLHPAGPAGSTQTPGHAPSPTAGLITSYSDWVQGRWTGVELIAVDRTNVGTSLPRRR